MAVLPGKRDTTSPPPDSTTQQSRKVSALVSRFESIAASAPAPPQKDHIRAPSVALKRVVSSSGSGIFELSRNTADSTFTSPTASLADEPLDNSDQHSINPDSDTQQTLATSEAHIPLEIVHTPATPIINGFAHPKPDHSDNSSHTPSTDKPVESVDTTKEMNQQERPAKQEQNSNSTKCEVKEGEQKVPEVAQETQSVSSAVKQSQTQGFTATSSLQTIEEVSTRPQVPSKQSEAQDSVIKQPGDELNALISQIKASGTNIARTIDALPQYGNTLPLQHAWTLHFSNTSGSGVAKKSAPSQTQADSYSDAIQPLFTAETVPELCGALKSIRNKMNVKQGDAGFGLSRMRHGMNLHFFRKGIRPLWEDPYCTSGGRITLMPPNPVMLDTLFQDVSMILAGSSAEIDVADQLGPDGPGGTICGVVGSRRPRGDRLEIWLGGKHPKTKPSSVWIDALRKKLAAELAYFPEVANAKYKSFYG